MAVYPDGVFTWADRIDGTHDVAAGDINAIAQEVIEIEKYAAKKTELSNPNLLIDPFFQINQRGQSSYSGTGRALDGWRCEGVGTINVGDGGITAIRPEESPYFNIYQPIERPQSFAGKIITLSLKCSGNITVILGLNGGYPNSARWDSSDAGIAHLSHGLPSEVGSLELIIQPRIGPPATIYAAKLELGEISTLANDAPPKIATDLAECQRYFRVWKTEAARTAALNEVGLMRLASPTLGTINIGGTTYYTASAEL